MTTSCPKPSLSDAFQELQDDALNDRELARQMQMVWEHGFYLGALSAWTADELAAGVPNPFTARALRAHQEQRRSEQDDAQQ